MTKFVEKTRWIPHPFNRCYDVCEACRVGVWRRIYGSNPDGSEYVDEFSYQYCPWCGRKVVKQEVEE